MNLRKILYNQYLTYQYTSGKVKRYRSGREKSKIEILKDLIIWQLKEGEFNTLYYAMGLNIQGTCQDDFVGRKTFLKIKNNVEEKIKQQAEVADLNYDVITKDKFYFTSILQKSGIPCINNEALVVSGKLIFSKGDVSELKKMKEIGEELILKKITWEGGEGVLYCKFQNDKIWINKNIIDANELSEILGNHIWVVQKKYSSHLAIRKVNQTALNTTRIVTIQAKNGPSYLTGFQSFATNNAFLDSWKYGSVYVGIDPFHNKLKKEGISSPEDPKPGILNFHPESKIEFSGYEIPFLREAVELCQKAHNYFYFNFIIGWDVVITDEGPFILEANEKPGMNVVQCLDGGLKKLIIQIANQWLTKQ